MLSFLGHVSCLFFKIPVSSVSNLENLVSWCNKWFCIDHALIALWWLHYTLANTVTFTLTSQSLSYACRVLRTEFYHFSFCQCAAWQSSDLRQFITISASWAFAIQSVWIRSSPDWHLPLVLWELYKMRTALQNALLQSYLRLSPSPCFTAWSWFPEPVS